MITSTGLGTGKAATGVPQAMASIITRPKVSVRLGKTKQSAALMWRANSGSSTIAREFCGRVFGAASCRRCRTVADQRPWCREHRGRERLRDSFHPANAALQAQNGTREVKAVALLWVEDSVVDTARPGPSGCGSARRARSCGDRRRWHHDGRTGRWKRRSRPQIKAAVRSHGNTQAKIFSKACVEAGGEGEVRRRGKPALPPSPTGLRWRCGWHRAAAQRSRG